MKNVIVNVLVGVVKVLFHAFGLCTCCKKSDKKEVSNEKTQNEPKDEPQGV